MADALADAKRRLQNLVSQCGDVNLEPIGADPWIISSLLQKSIRRGETEIAQRAALTLRKHKGSAIWRRFMVIAFEDVGIGNVEAVTAVVAAGTDVALRKACGGDERVAVHLAGVLAAAPKDRSADHLAGAKDHPALAKCVRAVTRAPLAERLSDVGNKQLPMPERAVAARFAAGLDGESVGSKADRDALLSRYGDLGVPQELIAAAAIAAARTREPITVMAPLIWLAADAGREVKVRECPIPPLVQAGDVPLYALDEHTRLGRQAIWRFACQNDAVRGCLERFVPAGLRRRAAHVAAFYVDAAPVARRLVWDQSERVEAFGLERDLLVAGVPAEGIEPLIGVIRANLDHLNALRAQVLAGPEGRPGMAVR